jgi:ABC-2 type transport system ATP-binding protein
VLHHGRIVAEGTPAELKSRADSDSLDDVFLALTESGTAPATDSEAEFTFKGAVR